MNTAIGSFRTIGSQIKPESQGLGSGFASNHSWDNLSQGASALFWRQHLSNDLRCPPGKLLALWCCGPGHCFWHWHPIPEWQLASWLLHVQSNYLLMRQKSQWKIPKCWSPVTHVGDEEVNKTKRKLYCFRQKLNQNVCKMCISKALLMRLHMGNNDHAIGKWRGQRSLLYHYGKFWWIVPCSNRISQQWT